MKKKDIFSCYDINDYEIMTSEMQDKGYKMFYINGKEICTIKKFFSYIKDIFPLDPPLSGSVNFDAFIDSLWSGLDNQEADKIAIIWKYPNELMSQDMDGFEKLVQCIFEVAENLSSEEYGSNKLIVLKVFFLGKGPFFTRWNKN